MHINVGCIVFIIDSLPSESNSIVTCIDVPTPNKKCSHDKETTYIMTVSAHMKTPQPLMTFCTVFIVLPDM